jgi:hypothetical protein
VVSARFPESISVGEGTKNPPILQENEWRKIAFNLFYVSAQNPPFVQPHSAIRSFTIGCQNVHVKIETVVVDKSHKSFFQLTSTSENIISMILKIYFSLYSYEKVNFLENNQIFHIIWKQATFSRKCYIVTLLHCYNKVVPSFQDEI